MTDRRAWMIAATIGCVTAWLAGTARSADPNAQPSAAPPASAAQPDGAPASSGASNRAPDDAKGASKAQAGQGKGAAQDRADGGSKPEATIRFQFDNVDYRTVIRRFAQMAGKPIIGDLNVEGTLTFFDSEEYTYTQAFDTLNIILEMRGYALVDEGRWFRLVQLKEIGARSQLLHGLDDRDANEVRPTEIVTVVLPLKFIDAATASKAVVRWVSSWGSISPLAKGKGVIITDRLSKIRRIRQLLKMLDQESLVQSQMKSYTLTNSSAKDVAEMLNQVFKASRRMVYNPQTGRYEPASDPSEKVTAVHDERTNSVLLLGAGDKIAMAEQIIDKLDRAERTSGGDVRIFQLASAKSEDIAKTVSQVMHKQLSSEQRKRGMTQPVRVVADAATNRVVVSAPVSEMKEIESLIRELDGATELAGGMRIFALKHADAVQLGPILSNAVSSRDRHNRRVSVLNVGVDAANNRLIVTGPNGQIETAAALVEQLDTPPKQAEQREVHVVKLAGAGDVYSIARALSRAFMRTVRDGRGRERQVYDVNVQADRSTNSLIVSARPEDWPKVQETIHKLSPPADGQDGAQVAEAVTRMIPLKHIDAYRLYRSLLNVYRYAHRGRPGAVPVVLSPGPQSKALIVSAAPADQEKITQLVEALDVAEDAEATSFSMIEIQAADAEKLVQKIRGLLPRDRRGRTEGVYIQADALTNTILLRADDERRETIEQMISQLDKATQTEARETVLLPLRHASAQTMAETVGRLFGSGSRYSRYRRGDDPKRVTITAAPGDRMLLIDAPRSKLKQIRALIQTMDVDEEGPKQEVRTYQLADASAPDIARSLSRIFARTYRRQRGRRTPRVKEPDPQFEADSGTNQLIVAATAQQFRTIDPLVQKLVKSPAVLSQAQTYRLKYVQAEDLVPVLEKLVNNGETSRYSRYRRRRQDSGQRVRIATLQAANTLIVQAPPAKQALVKELIETFDTEESGLHTAVEIVPLQSADAPSLAQTVRQAVAKGEVRRSRYARRGQADQAGVTVLAETNSNSLLVRGPARDVPAVVELIRKLDADSAEKTMQTKTFKLAHAKADDLVPLLQAIVSGESASRYSRYRRGASATREVRITAAKGANAIVVKAPKAQVDQVAELIAEFDTAESGAVTATEVVRLDNADAATLADSVNATLGAGRSRSSRYRRGGSGDTDKVTVVAERNSNSVMVRGPQARVGEVVSLIQGIDANSTLRAAATETFKLAHAQAGDIAPMIESQLAGGSASRTSRYRRSGSGEVQPTVSVVQNANAIVIKGTRAHLDLARTLIAEFDSPDSGVTPATEIVQLTNADASTLASSVNATLAGQTSSRRRYGRRGGGSQAPGVVVVPETNSNSVMVRGPKDDVADVVAMVREIDAQSTTLASQTRTFKLTHVQVDDVLPALREMVSPASRSRYSRYRRGSGGAEVRITALKAANTVIVQGPQDKLAIAQELIETFDVEDSSIRTTLEIVKLDAADPSQLAETVNQSITGESGGRRRYGRRGASEQTDRVVVIPESASRSLLVRGPASQVPDVVATIRKLDAEAAARTSETRTFELTHAKAEDLIEPIRAVLTGAQTSRFSRYSRYRRGGSSGEQVTITAVKNANAILIKAPADQLAQAEALIKQFDTPESGAGIATQMVRLEHADASALASSVGSMISGPRRSRYGRGGGSGDAVSITPETNSNSVLVRGPQAEVPEVVALIQKIDADSAALAGQTRTFKLTHVKTSDVLPVLQNLLGGQGGSSRYSRYRRGGAARGQVRIAEIAAASTIIVQGPTDKLAMAEELVASLDTAESGVQTTLEIVKLISADADDLAGTVNQMITGQSGRFSRWGRRGGGDEAKVVVIPESNSNSLLVRGPAGQVPDVVATIKKLDADAVAKATQTRTFELAHAQAETLLPVVQGLLGQQNRYGWRRGGSDSLKLQTVKATNAIVARGPADQIEEVAELVARFDTEKAASSTTTEIVPLVHADADTLAGTVNATITGQAGRYSRYRRSAPSDDEVTVLPERNSNSVIVRGPSGDVPEVVAMVKRIDADSGDRSAQTRTFQLTHAKAGDLAPMLQQAVAGSSGRYSRYRRSGAGQVAFSVTPMDKANALVVRGSKAQIDLAGSLIAEFDSAESGAKTTTEIVRLHNAQAGTIASSVSQMLSGSSRSSRYRRRGGGDDHVVIIPETHSNSVMVRGPESEVGEVVALIQRIDGDAAMTAPQTKTFKLQHVKVDDLLPVLQSMLSSGSSRYRYRRGGSSRDEVRIAPMAAANTLVITGPSEKLAMAEQIVRTFDTEASGAGTVIEIVRLQNAQADELVGTVNQMVGGSSSRYSRYRRTSQQGVSVIAETATNALIVRGPASEVPGVVETIRGLDADAANAAPQTKTFELQHAKAGDLAGTLREVLASASRSRWGRRGGGEEIRIAAVPNANSLIVKASGDVIAQAQALIAQFDSPDSGAKPTIEIVQLANADAGQLADAVNRTIGDGAPSRYRRGGSSGGEGVRVIPERNSNSVMVRGPADDVPEVVAMVKRLDADSTSLASTTRTFQLKHAKAGELVRVLEPMLTEGRRGRYRRGGSSSAPTRVVAMTATNALVVQGPAEKIALAAELIDTFDKSDAASTVIQVVQLDKAQADSLARSVGEALRSRSRRRGDTGEVSVTAETNSNSVLVRGPSEGVAEAVSMIRELDAESTGGEADVRVFVLDNADAYELSRSIGTLFRDIVRQQSRGRRGASIPFSVSADERTNSLVVSTTPAHFALVEGLVERLDKAEEKVEKSVEYVWLDNADAMTVAEQLDAMYRSRSTRDRPVIEADYFTNAITLIGSDADLKAMMQVVEKLDAAAKDNNIRVRVLTLKDTAAARMADLIRSVYGQMTESRIIVTDRLPERRPQIPALPNFAPDPALFASSDANAPLDAHAVADADANTPAPSGGDGNRPVVTVAVDSQSNSLIVSATRRELDNIEDLVLRLAASDGGGEAVYRIFKVDQADPTSVAETVNAVFNPQSPTKAQPRRAQRGKQQQKQVQAAPPAIHAVADVRTRSVIVRAKTRDMEQVEALIESLDQVSTIVSEVRVFQLENTQAEDVAANLRELFRLSEAPSRSSRGRRTPQQQRAEMIRQVIEVRGEGGVTQVDTSTQVSITANSRTNSVVVAAPADAMALIERMVQELDQSAATAKASVRMYPIEHAEVSGVVTTLRELFAADALPRRGRRGGSDERQEPVIVTGDSAGGQVVVSAAAEKHELIAKVIAELDSAQSAGDVTVKVYRLNHAEASGVAGALRETVSGSSGGRGRRGSPDAAQVRISADRSSNAIVVRASRAEHERFAGLIGELDVLPGGDSKVHMIPLANADADRVAGELNRLFATVSSGRRRGGGGAGVVVEADRDSRMVLVRADEKTFERIRAVAAKLDDASSGGLERTILKVRSAKATDVAAALSQAFAPQRGRRTEPDEMVSVVAEPLSNNLIVTANERNLERVKALLATLDTEVAAGSRSEFIVLKHADARELAGVLSSIAGGSSGSRRGRRGEPAPDEVVVTADASSNALVLRGPGKDVERLVTMAMRLDAAAEAKTASLIKTYAVSKADVNVVAQSLQQVFPQERSRGRRGQATEAPVVIVPDEVGGRLVVSAPKDKHALIEGVIQDLDAVETGSQIVVRAYKLKHADARSVGWTLYNTWQETRRARGAAGKDTKITGDSSSNTILVRATERDQVEIAKLIEQLDQPAEAQYPVRSIPLNNGEPEEVAGVLRDVLGISSRRGRWGWGVAKESVAIEASAESRLLLVRADDETFEKIRALARELDQETTGQATRHVLALKHAEAASVATALTRAFQPPRGKRLAPDDAVTVTPEAMSNSVIVMANEKNLQRVQALLADLDTEGGRRTEFLLLQHAKARELAEVLSRASSGGRGRRGSGGVTIAADSASNALVMTGASGEVDKMMKMALQLDQATVSAVPGVYIIGLENSDADAIARMIENLYRSQEQAARRERRSIDPLAVSADGRANAIVLATTESMYETVSKWVKEVEGLKPATGTYRLIPLDSADPDAVEKAIQEMLNRGGSMQQRGRGRRGSSGSTPSGRVKTTVLEKQKSILVEASDADYAEILKLVKALDEAAAKAKRVVKVFNLTHAANSRVASALAQAFRAERGADPEEQVAVIALQQTNALIVTAPKDRMEDVTRIIEQLDAEEVAAAVEFRIYPLEHASPQKVAPQIQRMLQQVVRLRPGESIDVQADERTKSVIITAKKDFFEQIEKVIEVLDRKPAFAASDVLIIPLKHADADRLAQVLTEMLRPSPTNEVTPEARALQEQLRRLRVKSTLQEKIPELDLTQPIKVTADPGRPQGSNSLILTSTPENLAALREIVELLDVFPLLEGTKVRIVHLKNADAEVVRNILREIFAQGRGLSGKPGTSVQGRAEPASESGKGLVNLLNVSADLRTNTLVLSGLTESVALAEAVASDLDRVDGKIVTDVKVFEITHADSRTVASILTNVFRENVDPWMAGARTYVSRLRTMLNGLDAKVSRIPKNRSPLTVQADPTANLVVVAARSDLMPLIAEVIKTLDVPGAAGVHAVRIFPLDNADASRIAQVVGSLYGGPNARLMRPEDVPTVTVDTRTNSLVVAASEKTFAIIDSLIRKLDADEAVDVREIALLPLDSAEATSLAATLQRMMDARVQRQQSLGVKDAEALRVIILADPRSNSLLVGGSTESFEIVSALAKKLDRASPALGGQIQTYPLKHANAGPLSSTLSRLFDQRYQAARTPDVQRQKPIILPDLRSNALLVSANKDDTKVLTSLLEKLDVELTDPAVRLSVVHLEHNDAAAVAPMLEGIFAARLRSMTAQGQSPSPQDTVDIAYDALSNSLILSASKENLSLIDGLLEKIDVEPPSRSGVVRMFRLENSDASRVATMLRNLISQGLYKPGLVAAGDNQALQAMEKVAIEVDTRTNVLIVSASKENFAVLTEIIEKIDGSEDFSAWSDIRTYTLETADATRLAPTLQEFFNAKRAAEQSVASGGRALPVTILPDARTNTLLVAGSRESFAAVEEMIQRLDGEKVVKANVFRIFKLSEATAGSLQETLQTLFDRRVERGDAKNPVTVLADARANALIVGATPEDMKLAEELVEKLDRAAGETGESLQVYPLARADAGQVAETLRSLFPDEGDTAAVNISVDERINAVVVTAGKADMKRIAELIAKLDRKDVTRVTEIRVFSLRNAEAENLSELLTTVLTNKPPQLTAGSPNRQTLLQFITRTQEGKELITSALQEGVLINADERTNSLIVSAPVDSMGLLETLIASLDSATPRLAEIRVFRLDNADAESMAEVLTDLFRLQGGATNGGKSIQYRLVARDANRAPSATLGSAEHHALSITVDVRTNSLLVGGTKQYVELVANVIDELDARPGQERQTRVYRLRNAQADEIETTLQDFLQRERQRLEQTLGDERMLTAQRLLEREVTVVAEPSNNALLLSASPRYFETISNLIKELDEPPPQVLIQVLLAEISLDDSTDFGFDWVYRQEDGKMTYTAKTNFGVQAGIDTFGGFNLSVTGSDLDVFFRALKSQGRMNVLQRPQVVAHDNQPAQISVGQRVPFITNSRITDNGDVVNTVQYEDVSIALNVTPRINPDGFVKLDVDQRIESLANSSVEITRGVNAVIVNSRQATTTVTVQDGHTILIGGLITTTQEDREKKIPFLGDVPLLGELFKSTSVEQTRTELLIVLTPRVLRSVKDHDEVTTPQVRRMNRLRDLSSGELKDAVFKLLDEQEGAMPNFDPNSPAPVSEPSTDHPGGGERIIPNGPDDDASPSSATPAPNGPGSAAPEGDEDDPEVARPRAAREPSHSATAAGAGGRRS